MAAQAVELSAPTATASHVDSTAGSSGRDRWWLLTLALVGLDAAAVVAAFALAYGIRFKTGLPFLETPPYSGAFYATVAIWSVPVWLLLLAAFRLYDRRLLFMGVTEYARVANACTAGLVAEVMLSFLDVALPISRGWLLLTWLLSIVLVCSGRFFARRVLTVLRRSGRYRSPTLIVGANEEGKALAEQLMADSGAGPQVLGYVDFALAPGTRVANGLDVVASAETLAVTIEQLRVKEVVIASTAASREQLIDLYRTIGQNADVEMRLSSGLFEILTTGMHVMEINRVPLMTPRRVRITGADSVVKTVIDYVTAALALMVLSPLLALLAVLVRLDSPGPVIHRRRVLGVSGRPFDAFKFRTMMVNAERRKTQRAINFPDRRRTLKSKADPRVTRFGAFLRRSSLDELPQLVNVLRGEMSLVGPRMIAPDEASRYGKWQFNLLTVKPGITGPWQVHGRGDIPYEERVRLSMDYIRNYSLWLDLEILVRTVFVVLLRRGAY
jgi:exopolysaccharide biosynthesis polyprenyl glycosylphosphotransferase